MAITMRRYRRMALSSTMFGLAKLEVKVKGICADARPTYPTWAIAANISTHYETESFARTCRERQKRVMAASL